MKSGGRFSANARNASALAGPAINLAKAAFSRERAARIGSRNDSVIVRFRDFDSQLKSAINRPVDPLTLQRVSQAVGVGLVHERAMSGNAHVDKWECDVCGTQSIHSRARR